MNAMTKTSGSAPARTAGAPPFSAALDRAFDQALRPIDGVARDPVLPAVADEAARHLAYLDRTTLPVAPGQVKDWLRPIAAAVRNSPVGDDFDIKAAVIALACRSIPARMFNEDTLCEALSTFRFFPAAADVVELFKGHTASLNTKRWALRMVANAKPAGPCEPCLGDAEREAVLAAFRPRFAAAVAPARTTAEQVEALARPAPARAAILSRGQLAAAYRAANVDPELRDINQARAERLLQGELPA